MELFFPYHFMTSWEHVNVNIVHFDGGFALHNVLKFKYESLKLSAPEIRVETKSHAIRRISNGCDQKSFA